jgi:hypothetical protein
MLNQGAPHLRDAAVIAGKFESGAAQLGHGTATGQCPAQR